MNKFYVRESQYKVSEMPYQLRPSSEIDRLGIENVSDTTLLSTVLRGNNKINPVDLSHGLLAHFQNFDGLLKAGIGDLEQVDGMTHKQAQSLMAALEIGKRSMAEKNNDMPVKSPEAVRSIMNPIVKGLEHENFYVLILNAKSRLAKPPIKISKGVLNACLVHPREVFKEAIRNSACNIILSHNHPSGDPTPSIEDIRITKQIVESGKIIDIQVLDHVIVCSPEKFVSLRENGIVAF